MCALKRNLNQSPNSQASAVKALWDFASAISELLYPALCIVCERRYASGQYSICPFCWKLTLRNRSSSKDTSDSAEDSDLSRQIPAISLGAYESPLADILQKFKYEGFIALGERLSLAMVHLRKERILSLKADAILPIPLHISGLKSRGFNQARVISDIVSMATGLPVAGNVVEKVVKTRNQAKLSAPQRQHNLAGAFVATESEWTGKRVIVIDDVITTGATIAEVGKTAEEAGVEVVGAVALSSAIEFCSIPVSAEF